MDKRTFYSQATVSDAYDQLRFGGASGARVNEREIALALDLVPREGRVLDLACGTGRLSRAIADRGQRVIGVDYSGPMAAKTAALGVPTVVGDGFGTPFQSGSFQAVVSMRFAFHYAELRPLLAEMRRLAVPHGAVVFDTYSWSPRAAIALGSGRWGGRVHIHSRRSVRETADRLGLHVQRSSPCFLFSPYLYRLLPLGLERRMESLESHVPPSWLCRTFWQLQT
jgi:SAM-dependent methyltransferase